MRRYTYRHTSPYYEVVDLDQNEVLARFYFSTESERGIAAGKARSLAADLNEGRISRDDAVSP